MLSLSAGGLNSNGGVGVGRGGIELDATVAFTVTLASGSWVRLPNAHCLSIPTVSLYIQRDAERVCLLCRNVHALRSLHSVNSFSIRLGWPRCEFQTWRGENLGRV